MSFRQEYAKTELFNINGPVVLFIAVITMRKPTTESHTNEVKFAHITNQTYSIKNATTVFVSIHNKFNLHNNMYTLVVN